MGISSCCLVMWLYLHCKNISSKVTRLVSDSTDKTKCDLQEYLSKKSFEAWYGVKVTELEKITENENLVKVQVYGCHMDILLYVSMTFSGSFVIRSWILRGPYTTDWKPLIFNSFFQKKANKSKQEWLK